MISRTFKIMYQESKGLSDERESRKDSRGIVAVLNSSNCNVDA